MRRLFLASACALLAAAPPAAAQQVLEFPANIRSYGMGFTGVSDSADPTNSYYNPAVLASVSGVYGAGMLYGPADLTGDIRFRRGVLGGGVRLMESRPVAVEIGVEIRTSNYTPADIILPSVFAGAMPDEQDQSERAFALGAGVLIHQNYALALGVTHKAVRWYDGFAEQSGRAYDVGFLASVRLKTAGGLRFAPSVGASRVNVGDVDETPVTRVGVGVRFETGEIAGLSESLGNRVPLLAATVNVDAQDTANGAVTAVGAELVVIRAISLRIGSTDIDNTDTETTYGIGIGLPINEFHWRLDFANGRLTPQGQRRTDIGVIVGVTF